jgi:hypothetical protein
MVEMRSGKAPIRRSTRIRFVVLAIALLVPGCASRRHYERVGSCPSIDTTKVFYVVVNSVTEKVDYDYFGGALIPGRVLDYDEYAKGRVRGDAKLDVPIEILRYLKARGKIAALGPPAQAPPEDATIISYDELWGWDMRPIIKALKIHASPAGQPAEEISVKFEEMTIFNTQPVASSIVPAMMDVLFQSAPPQP